MNTAQEIAETDRIKQKLAEGGRLTPVEERIMAYSPYGYASGCPSCYQPTWPPEMCGVCGGKGGHKAYCGAETREDREGEG